MSYGKEVGIESSDLEDLVEFLIVLGREDCVCGDPNCPAGKALRDEVQRRKGNGPTESGNSGAISATELEKILKLFSEDFSDQIGQGVFAALRVYDDYRRNNAIWRRLVRRIAKPAKKVLGVILFPLTFVWGFVKYVFLWKEVENLINEAQEAEKEMEDANPISKSILTGMNILPKEGFVENVMNGLPSCIRLGYRLGKWGSQRKAGIASRWANRPRWLGNKK